MAIAMVSLLPCNRAEGGRDSHLNSADYRPFQDGGLLRRGSQWLRIARFPSQPGSQSHSSQGKYPRMIHIDSVDVTAAY